MPDAIPDDWADGLSPILARIATPEVTGRIVAYRRGLITLDDLTVWVVGHDFVVPERLARKRDGETVEEMYARVEEWGDTDTPGSWDEMNTANNTGLLSDDDYDHINRAVWAAAGR